MKKLLERTEIHPIKHLVIDGLIAIVFGGLVALGVSTLVSKHNASVRYANATETVVKVECPNVGHGSGVLVNKSGSILTNAHVANMCARPKVITKDGRKFNSVMLWSTTRIIYGPTSNNYEGEDVAMLVITDEHKPLKYAYLRCSKVRQGEAVYAVGHPLRVDWAVTFGNVSTHKGNKIVTDVTVLPGNSGGALFDASDRLIGLPQSVATYGYGLTGQTFAVSNTTLCTLLGRDT